MFCVCRRSCDSLSCRLIGIVRFGNEQFSVRDARKLFVKLTNTTVNSMKNSWCGIHPQSPDNRKIGLNVLSPALLLYVSSSFFTTSLGCLSYSSVTLVQKRETKLKLKFYMSMRMHEQKKKELYLLVFFVGLWDGA